MDKLTAIRIKYDDGTYSDEIPINVLVNNIQWDNAHTLIDVLGSIAIDTKGSVQDQLNQLFSTKVDVTNLSRYVDTQISQDVTAWLDKNVNPVGSAVAIDSSLTVSGTAADAKVAGDEISGLKEDLTSELLNGNAFDILPLLDHPDGTHRGVTFTWTDDNHSCTVVGTASGGMAVRTFFNKATGFPKGMHAGGTYRLKYTSTDVVFQLYKYTNGVFDSYPLVSSRVNKDFVIPANASGVQIRLAVSEGNTVNETVSPVLLTEVLTNDELDEKIADANKEMYEYVSGSSGKVTSGVLNEIGTVDEWVLNAYIDENDGEIKPVVSEGVYTSASKNMIVIPDGMEIHVHGASRIAKYDADSTFLGKATVNSDTIISSDDAAYIRIQYGSIDTQVLGFYVWYYYTATDQAQSIETKIDNSCERVQNPNITISSVSGNPLVLTECDDRSPFDALAVSGIASNETVVVCQKNLFAIRHTSGIFTKNNVKFQFNTINHTIRIFTESGQSASASTTSVFADFGDDFKTVDGSTFYHNFKFRFPVDTRVSVTDNANGEVTFDFGIQMRVYDGTNIINVGTGGVSFTALADTEYVIYFLVQEGWSGDITYAPQVEISPYPTAYEKFNGFKTALTASGNENIFECGGILEGRYTKQSGAIKALFDSATDSVYLNAHNDTDFGIPVYDTHQDGTVNGQSWYYIDKFTVGHVASSLSDLLTNGGKYTLQAADMESGQWSYSTKAANTARARCKSLIPVHAGEKVIYSNTTFDTYFGVLATSSSPSYVQAIGWKTNGGGTISINVDGYLAIIIRNHSDTSATVNPADYDSTITIVPESIPVCVRLFNTKYAKLIYGELYDGSNLRIDYTGNGFFLNADVGKEYGVRLGIRDHAAINAVIKPVIATGIYALREYGTYPGTTVVYTDKDASFTVRQHQISTKTKSELSRSAVNSILTLTGDHIMTPFATLKKRGGLVSFIDDDTWNMYCVQRYHDIFAAKGVLGGYAVITENMVTNPSTMQPADPDLLPTLLEYEQEGFAMLYHCHDQNGANTRYWIKGDPSYDQSLINDNFMSGLRAIKTMGFSNYKYWVTPYGVNDKYIQDLAKNHGMQCLFNCPSAYAQEGYVSAHGNVSRWNIPRVIFGNWTTNDAWLHRAIQGAKAAKGWVIIVSHVDSWGAAGSESNIALGNRLSALIQYCLDEGLEIVPAPVAFEEYRASFMLNELF